MTAVARRGVSVLGSTGWIGRQTLDVVAAHRDRFRVVALAARARGDLLYRQVRQFGVRLAALADEGTAAAWADAFRAAGCTLLAGAEGLEAVAAAAGADVVVAAVVGAAGLRPVLAALRAGRTVALATKEALVMAGPLVLAEAARHGARILPVDGEHNAIFQCLQGRSPHEVRRVILTASGGPFRGWPREALAEATPEQAVRHPNWPMGPKISVDSATLMNKGLEVIEAQYLFGLDVERVGVLIHPQSVVHGLVELVDGALLAHLSAPDMRLMIQYCLSYPERLPGTWAPLDLAGLGTLQFEPADPDRYPCLALALAAARAGGTAPAVLNAANEVAVEAFLDRRIRFTDIAAVVEETLAAHPPAPVRALEDVLEADAWARDQAAQHVRRRAGAAPVG